MSCGRPLPPRPGPGVRYPRADQLMDVPPEQVPWVAPPVGPEHAAELLRQALVADVQRSALELTVASVRLAAHTARRATRRRSPWLPR